MKKHIYTALVFMFCLLSVLRFDVGWDYFAYWLMQVPMEHELSDILFSKYADDINYAEFGRLEVLFKVFYYIAEWFEWRALFFIITGVLTYAFVFSGIKCCSPDVYSSFFVYLAFCYLLSLGCVRQALAVAIVFYSMRYVLEKKKTAFLLLIFIAGFAHKSAWMMVFLYPIYYMFSLKSVAIGCTVAVFSGQMLRTFLYKTMSYSIYDDIELHGGTIMIWFNVVVFAIVLWTVFKFSHQNELEQNIRLLKVVMIGLAFPFIFGGHIGGRISAYFNIFYVLLLPNIFLYVFERQKILRICFYFLCCSYFLFSIYWSSRNEQKSPYIPYRCVLFTDTTVWKKGTFDNSSQAYIDRVL